MKRRTEPKEIVIPLRRGEEMPVKCPHCELPIGRIVGGEFHFFSHHHGERHAAFVKIEGRNARLGVK